MMDGRLGELLGDWSVEGLSKKSSSSPSSSSSSSSPAAASSPLSSPSSTDHHAIIDLKFGSFNPGIVFVRGAILCEIYYRKAKACFAIKVNGAEI